MPNVTMSDVVDVFCSAGGPKHNKVSSIKNRAAYQPAFDYYKPLREGIIGVHVKGQARTNLDKIVDLAHVKKTENYFEAIAGYKRWWGRKAVQWFDPPRAHYNHLDVSVIVNPNLGLTINGERFVIKLYCKDEPLLKLRLDPVLGLMELGLRPLLTPDVTVGVLDLRRGKLHQFGGRDPVQLKAMVNGELAYISTVWPTV